jgi:hypothetical protein
MSLCLSLSISPLTSSRHYVRALIYSFDAFSNLSIPHPFSLFLCPPALPLLPFLLFSFSSVISFPLSLPCSCPHTFLLFSLDNSFYMLLPALSTSISSFLSSSLSLSLSLSLHVHLPLPCSHNLPPPHFCSLPLSIPLLPRRCQMPFLDDPRFGDSDKLRVAMLYALRYEMRPAPENQVWWFPAMRRVIIARNK